MILKKGAPTFELPEAVEPSTISLVVWSNGDPKLNPGSYLMALHRVRIEEILRMKDSERDLRGIPTMFAFCHDGGPYLRLFPVPDKDYDAVMRYCPAMREI